MEAQVISLKGNKAVITLTDEQIAEIGRQQDPYIQACIKLGETPRPELIDCTNQRVYGEDCSHRLEVCIDAKNAIEQPDGTYKIWKPIYDGNERHYLPRHIKSGSVWAYNYYVSWFTITLAGPRREYKSHELMMEGVEEFAPYYDRLYNS